MAHTLTKLTEAELIAEIQRITGLRYNHAPTIVTEGSGDASNASPEIETGQPTLIHAGPSFSRDSASLSQATQPKKKRGRPFGSRNKPKEPK